MAGVIILAGGFGVRTLKVTGNLPKCLVKTASGETILGLTLDDLINNCHLDNIAVVSNGLFFDVISHFVKTFYPEQRIIVLNDGKKTPEERLGALGDLLFALESPKLSQWGKEDLLVLPSDTAYTSAFSLKEFLVFAEERKNDFVTVVYDTHDLEKIKNNLGCVVLGKDSRIVEFEEKPQFPKSSLTILATYLYRSEQTPLLSKFKEDGGNLNSPSNIMPYLMTKGIPISAFVVPNNVIDANNPIEIEKVKSY